MIVKLSKSNQIVMSLIADDINSIGEKNETYDYVNAHRLYATQRTMETLEFLGLVKADMSSIFTKWMLTDAGWEYLLDNC